MACEVYGSCSRICSLFILRDIGYKLWMWLRKQGSMSQRDGGVNRQHSLETGLSQAIRPMLICASESSVSVKNQQVRSEIPRSLTWIKLRAWGWSLSGKPESTFLLSKVGTSFPDFIFSYSFSFYSVLVMLLHVTFGGCWVFYQYYLVRVTHLQGFCIRLISFPSQYVNLIIRKDLFLQLVIALCWWTFWLMSIIL